MDALSVVEHVTKAARAAVSSFISKSPAACNSAVEDVSEVACPPAATSETPNAKEWARHLGRITAVPDEGAAIPSTITRVVLVNGFYPDRSVTEKWAESWSVHIQDEGRTLKLFPNKPTEPRYEYTPGFFDLPKETS